MKAGNWQAMSFGFKLTDLPKLLNAACSIIGSEICINEEGHAFT
jgi:hypothetical protein